MVTIPTPQEAARLTDDEVQEVDNALLDITHNLLNEYHEGHCLYYTMPSFNTRVVRAILGQLELSHWHTEINSYSEGKTNYKIMSQTDHVAQQKASEGMFGGR